MLILLIIVSLLLHLGTFLWIRTQAGRMSALQEKEQQWKEQSERVEELLSTYLYEVKEENNRLLSLLESYPANENAQERIQPEKNRPQDEKDQIKGVPDQRGQTIQEQSDYSPPVHAIQADILEQSDSGQVITLYEKGKSVEEIARTLDCGKTEVELMLKFYRKA